MKRRSFLKAILAFLGAASAASFVYPLSRYLAPSASTELSRTLVIAKRDIPLGDAKEIVFNGVPAVILNRPGRGL